MLLAVVRWLLEWGANAGIVKMSWHFACPLCVSTMIITIAAFINLTSFSRQSPFLSLRLFIQFTFICSHVTFVFQSQTSHSLPHPTFSIHKHHPLFLPSASSTSFFEFFRTCIDVSLYATLASFHHPPAYTPNPSLH